MSIKLRLKTGEVELDYEGEEAFIKAELANILASVSGVHPTAPRNGKHEEMASANGVTESAPALSAGVRFERTVANILVKLGNKEQQDLAIAAAAYLTLTHGKGDFYRKELLEAMKSATGYFKRNHSKNLSSILDGLMKEGKFHELGKDRYSLEGNFLEEIKRRLGIA